MFLCNEDQFTILSFNKLLKKACENMLKKFKTNGLFWNSFPFHLKEKFYVIAKSFNLLLPVYVFTLYRNLDLTHYYPNNEFKRSKKKSWELLVWKGEYGANWHFFLFLKCLPSYFIQVPSMVPDQKVATWKCIQFWKVWIFFFV